MVACFTPLYQQIFHVQFVFMKNNACLCQKDVEKLEFVVHYYNFIFDNSINNNSNNLVFI